MRPRLYLAHFLLLLALGDLSRGGSGWGWLTVEWPRMFDRTGALTFEAIAMVSAPGVTLLISPLNILLGGVLSVLAGLNLVVTLLGIQASSLMMGVFQVLIPVSLLLLVVTLKLVLDRTNTDLLTTSRPR